jgi:hypothetical protein
MWFRLFFQKTVRRNKETPVLGDFFVMPALVGCGLTSVRGSKGENYDI